MVTLPAGGEEWGVEGVEIVEGLVGGAREKAFHSIILLSCSGSMVVHVRDI